jgi:signal transduction histidine kinase
MRGSALAKIGLQADERVGRSIVEVLGSADNIAVRAVRAALEGAPTKYHYAFGGREFENVAEPMRDHDGAITGVVHSAYDITEHRQSEHALRESREELRRLSAAMNQIQENERRRIARTVHDELGQRLTALRFEVGLLRRDLRGGRTDSGEPRIASMLELIDEIITTVRRVATELRPAVLDDFGLRAALEQEARAFESRTGITVTLDVEPEHVDAARAAALYRIVQEALTNVARHSGATHVEVRVAIRESHIEAEIRDNGRGISAGDARRATSLGLIGVRERAYAFGGDVLIEGKAGGGTRLFVTLPHEDPHR